MPELNAFLQPVGAPITRAQQFQSSMDFDSGTDRNTVTFSKIKNFSFNAGTGGTLTLGGDSGQNGQLILRDSSGNVIIVADQLGFDGYNGSGTSIAGTLGDNINFHLNEDGLSIYNGSITIYNNQGTTIIDNFGLNSLNVFPNSDQVAIGLTQQISGTTRVPITGGTLTFSMSRAGLVLINISTNQYMTGIGYGIVGLYINGTAGFPAIYSGANDIESGATHYIFSAPSGTHSLVIQGQQDGGAGTMNMYSYNFSYIKLGR